MRLLLERGKLGFPCPMRVLPHMWEMWNCCKCSSHSTFQDSTNGGSFLKWASVALVTWICKVQDFVPVCHYSKKIICKFRSAVPIIIWGTTGSLFPASSSFFLLFFSLGFNCLIDICFKGIYWEHLMSRDEDSHLDLGVWAAFNLKKPFNSGSAGCPSVRQ